MAQEMTGLGKTERKSLSLATIGAWLSVLAAIALPIYGIGHLILVRQFSLAYNYSWPTAWYAASLVSKTQVVGVLLDFLDNPDVVIRLPIALVLAALLLGAVALTRQWLQPEAITAIGWGNLLAVFKPRTKPLWVGIVQVVFLLVVLGWLVRSAGLVEATRALLGMGVIIFGILLAMLDYHRGLPLPVRLVRLVLILNLFLLFSLTIGTAPEKPTLPEVELATETGATVQGQLLSHVDGYWYIITSDDNTLRVLPDSTIKGGTIPKRVPSAQVTGTPGAGTPRPTP